MIKNYKGMRRLKRWKDKITGFLNGRYGIDDLGRAIFLVDIIVYTLSILSQNSVLAMIAMIGFMIFVGRMLSGAHWERSEENRKFLSWIRLWKLRYENRKTARIYMCSKCGRYIRVPKGKGKIEISCPGCRNRMIRNT
jgi:DNA-directed RNA polymerase subunit RPC12/RpoP